MSTPVYGFVFQQTDLESPPPILSDFSVLGLVLPSDDANNSVFPLNVPVAINTGDTTVLAAAGSGPLYTYLNRINAQLADLQRSALAVVVRVGMAYENDGTTEDVIATTVNIVGDPAAKTGLYALLTAPGRTGYTPRLIGAPGYTGWTEFAVTAPVITAQGDNYVHPLVTFNPPGATAVATVGNLGTQATGTASVGSGGVTGIAVTNQGNDYDVAPTVTLTGGGGTGATAHAVLTAGRVSSVVVDTAGTGYTTAPAVSIAAPAGGQISAINLTHPGSYALGVTPTITITDSAGGTGTGATVVSGPMEQLANPICAALPSINGALLAHAIVGGPGTTKADAIAWRSTISDQRTIPVDEWEIIADGAENIYVDGAGRTLGIGVRVDFIHGGYPFWSFANQPVQGILGTKRIDALSLVDGATDGEELLAVGIGVTARGDLSDTSVANSGWVHISWQNAGNDTNFSFYNKTRGRDFTNIALLKSIRQRLGKDNITVHSVQSVLNDMEVIMTDLKVRDCVIDFSIGFSAADNTVAGLRAGKFTVFDNSEEPAPILVVTIKRGLDTQALVNELAALAATAPTLTGGGA